mgnify:CR=1 FL=1
MAVFRRGGLRSIGLPTLRLRIDIGETQAPAGYLPLEAQLVTAQPLEDVRSAPDTLAAIVYTGGTTGFPKGVMLSHGNLWASLLGRMAEVPNPPHYVTLLTSPMFHVAGLGRMLGQTIVGGTCVTVPSFQPQQVVEIMAREGVNDLVIVPSMLQMLLDTPASIRRACPGWSGFCGARRRSRCRCCGVRWRHFRRWTSSMCTA